MSLSCPIMRTFHSMIRSAFYLATNVCDQDVSGLCVSLWIKDENYQSLIWFWANAVYVVRALEDFDLLCILRF